MPAQVRGGQVDLLRQQDPNPGKQAKVHDPLDGSVHFVVGW
jgi:hypothetical protein